MALCVSSGAIQDHREKTNGPLLFSGDKRNMGHDELGLSVSVALETVIHNGENLGLQSHFKKHRSSSTMKPGSSGPRPRLRSGSGPVAPAGERERKRVNHYLTTNADMLHSAPLENISHTSVFTKVGKP